MEEKKEINKNIQFEEGGDLYYGVGAFIWEVAKVFFWALVIIVPIRVFLFQPFFVQGASMEPNFHDGDYLIVNEVGYKKTKVGLGTLDFFTINTFKDFERGDVVIFRYPLNPDQFFIKRIIALPGESIAIADGKIKIFNAENPEGFLLEEEAYLESNFDTSGTMAQELKNDEYFVIGDNRNFSHDSRSWGPIRKSDVIGRAFIRVWPFDKMRIF